MHIQIYGHRHRHIDTGQIHRHIDLLTDNKYIHVHILVHTNVNERARRWYTYGIN